MYLVLQSWMSISCASLAKFITCTSYFTVECPYPVPAWLSLLRVPRTAQLNVHILCLLGKQLHDIVLGVLHDVLALNKQRISRARKNTLPNFNLILISHTSIYATNGNTFFLGICNSSALYYKISMFCTNVHSVHFTIPGCVDKILKKCIQVLHN